MRIYAWRTILGVEGVINGDAPDAGPHRGADPRASSTARSRSIIAMTNFLVPLAVLPIYASMQNVSPGLLEAARDLGSGRLDIVRRVVLPLTMPGRPRRGRVQLHRLGR